MESYSKRNHILYYLCNLYFHFSFFLLCCSVISMSQFPNSGRTTFYPSIALLMHWPEHFITSPGHWQNSHWVFMFQLGNVDKEAEKKKNHNLSQSEFSRSLHANAKGKCSPCTCCPWLPNITTSSTSGSGLAIKQNFQWCFCLESYFASPRHLSLALKQLTQVLILSTNVVCQKNALIRVIFVKPGEVTTR